ncbi:PrnB family protein [Thalassotalea sp. PLHSN55]|uniref:PrnB family protein n=1 Tax=Thalassotalea sp. PLHSN55 TaxID=3435888 RepID=UPI003F862799
MHNNQTATVKKLDQWIRGEFKELNTRLDNIYFDQDDRSDVNLQPQLTKPLTKKLTDTGQALISDVLKEGNTDNGFDSGYDLLGNVGIYMAACRRHEITEPSREKKSPLIEASALAMQIGASLGVTPRFSTSHLTTHNLAVNGEFKSFTSLDDELLFIDYNTRGILGYKRCADALIKLLPLGISHPLAAEMLTIAKQALNEVIQHNDMLFKCLNPQRFFYCVRPYYKPYRVGQNVYRGANAGDFSGINAIDLLLGLCQGQDPYYSQILVDKFLFMMPEEQAILRDCMRKQSLLDALLSTNKKQVDSDWFQHNAQLFLEVCQLHGRAATQHHQQLVERFIKQMSVNESPAALKNITASGPPLPVLLASLEKLKDLRTAAKREDIPSRFQDIEKLRGLIRYYDENL